MAGYLSKRIDSEQCGPRYWTRPLRPGINFFDTARGYSDSEEKFGTVLGPRHSEVIIATKIHRHEQKKLWRLDVETSLRNLQVDSIDLYQLHNVPYQRKS